MTDHGLPEEALEGPEVVSDEPEGDLSPQDIEALRDLVDDMQDTLDSEAGPLTDDSDREAKEVLNAEPTSQEILNKRLVPGLVSKSIVGWIVAFNLATAGVLLHDNPYAESAWDWTLEHPEPSLITAAVFAGAVALRAAFKHNRQEDLFEAQHDGVRLRERVANHLPSLRAIGIVGVLGALVWAGWGIKGAHDRRLAERNADPSEYEHEYGEPYHVLTSTIGCDKVGETEVRPGEDSLWEIAIETLYLNGMPITNENIAAVNNHMAQDFDKDPKRMQVGDKHNTYYCETPDEGAITTEESEEQHFNGINRHLEKEYGVRIVLPVNPSS